MFGVIMKVGGIKQNEAEKGRKTRKKRENQIFVSELAKVFLFLHIDI